MGRIQELVIPKIPKFFSVAIVAKLFLTSKQSPTLNTIANNSIAYSLKKTTPTFLFDFLLQQRLATEGRNDTLIGHLIVLLQYGWPREEATFYELLDKIRDHGGLKYRVFFNYVSSILLQYFLVGCFVFFKLCKGLKYEQAVPSSPEPLYQNEGKCSAFDMEMILHCRANKTHFHKNVCALGLILKVRIFGTRKQPIKK